MIPSSEIHGILKYLCVHRIQVCIAVEFMLWVCEVGSTLIFFYTSKQFIMHQLIKYYFCCSNAFQCHCYHLYGSHIHVVHSQIVYSVPANLLRVTAVVLHCGLLSICSKPCLLIKHIYVAVFHKPLSVLHPSWIYNRIIWSSFMKSLLGLCLDVY